MVQEEERLEQRRKDAQSLARELKQKGKKAQDEANAKAKAAGQEPSPCAEAEAHLQQSREVAKELEKGSSYELTGAKLEKKEQYREWASTFKDVANMKKNLLVCLEWAEDQKEAIDDLSPSIGKGTDDADMIAINKEIFDAVASSVKGPDMMRIKESTDHPRHCAQAR